jgi:hypothetical protein
MSWTAAELKAREHLVALVTEWPGLTGKELWQRLDPRPADWGIWDVTSIVLDLAIGRDKRIRETTVHGGWRFWPLEARELREQGPRKPENDSDGSGTALAQIEAITPHPTSGVQS